MIKKSKKSKIQISQFAQLAKSLFISREFPIILIFELSRQKSVKTIVFIVVKIKS